MRTRSLGPSLVMAAAWAGTGACQSPIGPQARCRSGHYALGGPSNPRSAGDPFMNTLTPGPAPRPTPYFGKYRGIVTNNDDPQQIGRIMVQVPDVLGTNPSAWALPCVPAAGFGSGVFVVPP